MKNDKFNYAILIVVILLLVILNAFNQVSIRKIKNHSNKNSSQIELQLINDEIVDKIYKDQHFYSTRISGNGIIYDSKRQKNIQIKDIVEEKPLLVLRFSSNDCDPCIDKLMEQLKVAAETIGINNIIIISDFKFPRQIGVFLREHDIGFMTYSLPRFDFGQDIDKFTPYFFVLDEDLIMKNLFFTFHSFQNLNEEYFNPIKERYFLEN